MLRKKMIECWEKAVGKVFNALKPGASIAEVAGLGMSVYEDWAPELKRRIAAMEKGSEETISWELTCYKIARQLRRPYRIRSTSTTFAFSSIEKKMM